jgi:hypothetical protein
VQLYQQIGGQKSWQFGAQLDVHDLQLGGKYSRQLGGQFVEVMHP